MARRQVVESANSALKGAFADISRWFFRVTGLVKTTVLLGFTLATYNLDRIRSYKARHALDDQAKWSSGRSRAGLGDARDVDGNSRIRPRSPAQVADSTLTAASRSSKGRLQHVRRRLQAASAKFERSTAED